MYNLDRQWSLAANIAYTERAPTTYELFANGPHGATGTYEVGSPDFKKERSTSIDLALRRRSGPDSMSLGVFQTKFQNYLLLTPSGRNRGEDGSLEDPATPGTTTTGLAAGLPEFVYQQVPALFQGLEAQGRWRLLDRGGTLDFEAKADYVRATNRDTDAPLPRIAPLRLGAGLVYQVSDWYARAEITRLASQTRVAPNELPTDGYTMVNAYASYRIKGGPVIWEVFLRGTNLLNVEARNHVSVLKDVAPLTGRNIMLGVRANF